MSEALQPLMRFEIVRQALDIWSSGGWAMIALAVNAMLLFGIGANLWLNLRARGFAGVSEKKWRSWVRNPNERKGPVGELIGFVMKANTLEDMSARFDELQIKEVAPIGRDLRFMRRAVSVAPLLGLLGTVTGMLSTFRGLATGGGGDKTMDMVAGGISEALITTETGLVLAVPGLFLHYHLSRQRDRYQNFLAHLQTFCTQYVYKTVYRGAVIGRGGEA